MPLENRSRLRRRPSAKPAAPAQRPPVDAAEALALTRRVLADQAQTIAIGRRYLARYPREADPAVLSRRLLWGVQADDLAAVRAVVRRRIRRDLRRGEVVRIDGWTLARSECRACALVALAAAPLS